ncbi:MAG TPA: hypothetical protein PKJ94_03950, partial [Ferruginibacter sp.]|nr:hypothetical protein [Ferruginibacter sp.]
CAVNQIVGKGTVNQIIGKAVKPDRGTVVFLGKIVGNAVCLKGYGCNLQINMASPISITT